VDAVLAVGRSEVTREHPWSLSPAALTSAPVSPRLVLPSPNGSAIAANATNSTLIAACLRNVRAVARWLHRRAITPDQPVTLIAAGEHWPDGSPRPASEDLLGAGAIVDALATLGIRGASPEAESVRALFAATAVLPDAIRHSASGVQLIRGGFGADVEVAVQQDASDVVPVLTDGAFRAG
jgi:2-phosphosulfolactate phosphatase